MLNSARPQAPGVLHVIPIDKRVTGCGSISRVGGGLREYLNRPWLDGGEDSDTSTGTLGTAGRLAYTETINIT